jgi:hypothetical protein
MSEDIGSARPYRLYDSKLKANLPGCCYKTKSKALEGAARRLLWVKIGTTLEVLNVNNTKLIAQFSKTPTGFKIWPAPGSHQWRQND